jgi:hypothetical protein
MKFEDKQIILDIVADSFSHSPRFLAILKNGNTEKQLKIMASYAYELIKKFNGVYLSKDKSTVIFYYRKSEYRRNLMDILRYIRLFILCIKPRKALLTLQREKQIKELRPELNDYIYVWVLGSDPKKTSIRGLADIRDHLFGLSEKYGLPILIETTVEKLLKLYTYVGFEVYNEWFDDSIGMKVWMLKKGSIGDYPGQIAS